MKTVAGASRRISTRAAGLIVLMSALATSAIPASDPSTFLKNYCYDCHGEEKQKGDRRFDQLVFPIKDEHGLVEVVHGPERGDDLLDDAVPSNALTHVGEGRGNLARGSCSGS